MQVTEKRGGEKSEGYVVVTEDENAELLCWRGWEGEWRRGARPWLVRKKISGLRREETQLGRRLGQFLEEGGWR